MRRNDELTGGARVHLKDVSKRYGLTGPDVVSDVSLEIEPGEFVVLLGPSGSGKTTTLNMIAGFIEATSGQILLDGVDISTWPPERRNFGMVFQNYALFPHMDVATNIAYALRRRKVKKASIDRSVSQALELVGLEGFGARKPSELSGGQQQRVALARAVVFSPRVLLLDEPLGALDRKLRQKLQTQIAKIHRELGITFIFVTHDQEEAMFLGDRMVVFGDGVIEQVGPPGDVYNNPRSEFVAQFVGESNVFRGRFVDGHYTWRDQTWSVSEESALAGGEALVVRPERVSVMKPVAGGDEAPGRSSALASVVNFAFLGTSTRIELDFGGGVKGSAVLERSQEAAAVPGDEVCVSWAVEDQRFVP